MRKRRDPRWMAHVKVGDVLENHNGRSQRVVRSVWWHKGKLAGVVFTIKHYSWTGACHTCVETARLKSEGWRPTGVRRRLRTPLDRKIAEDVAQRDYRKRKLKCCDVIGVP
jgi:hypothetical protein